MWLLILFWSSALDYHDIEATLAITTVVFAQQFVRRW